MKYLGKYNNFRQEQDFDLIIESLIFESQLVFSDKLKSIVESLPDSKIKREVLLLIKTGKDLNIAQNFFDVSDGKDNINFVQDRKAQEILGVESIKWEVIESHRRLTLNKDYDGNYKNQAIFDELGFDPNTMGYEKPNEGQIGEILSEAKSKDTPGKIYVLFKWDDNQYSIYDKQALKPKDVRLEKVWQLTKNPIAVGRGFRSILTAAKIAFTDRELEKFVNDYKASFDIFNDAFSKFDVINGTDIGYWYRWTNYESRKSTLGNSCMSDVSEDYFDIYCMNPKTCSLVILYSDKGGSLVNGKYVSNKIRGRALLWKTNIGMFMDRIYTNNDADVNLFIAYADKNDWWHKKYQDSNDNFTAVKNGEEKTPIVRVELDEVEFDYYPYVDTLCYLSKIEYYLTNHIRYNNLDPGMYELRSTEGGSDELS